MAVREDQASCWFHKDLTLTKRQTWALLTGARALRRKDEYQVRPAGFEQEYWMGITIDRLGSSGFRGTFTAGDKSDQKGAKMGAGYVSADKKEKLAEEGGTRRGSTQLEPFGTSGLCLGITRRPCDT